MAPHAPARVEVRTLNRNYDRRTSRVLVREVPHATRAALDYAAYHANFMIAEAAPEDDAPAPARQAEPSHTAPFGSAFEPGSLTGDIGKTQLTAAERTHPFAFAPLSDFLLAKKVEGAEHLEELGSAVRSETFGGLVPVGHASQTIAELYLHHAAGDRHELWVKLEFAPWFHALGELPDQDRDGVPELYARARPGTLTSAVVHAIESDYASRALTRAELQRWANELSSYWYPSFNTDLVPAPAAWPDAQTEPEITAELAGLRIKNPAIVLRGKPQGAPSYEIFVVHGLAAQDGAPGTAATVTAESASTPAALDVPKTKPSPDVATIAQTIADDLAREGGGSFTSWADHLSPFRDAVQHALKTMPPSAQGFAGGDGFLFYRKSMAALLGGDLEAQPQGKNPLPSIIEYKDALAALGVDFLFVPVPSKEELFPDELDPKSRDLVAKIVNPWPRKLMATLATHGVESIDLLTPLLRARAQAVPDQEPLYQHQDTHWTSRGLQLAASVVATRIRAYPWYRALAAHAVAYHTQPTTFTRFGDLHSRLPERQRKRFHPETLRADQVVRPDGTAYEDDPESPIVVLGDSFTGVYELTDAEHAGFSAHVAREISFPVDLVMSYGGGPNVRNKLMRRGEQQLARKRLVIWVMAARDLYNYWEDWEPLKRD